MSNAPFHSCFVSAKLCGQPMKIYCAALTNTSGNRVVINAVKALELSHEQRVLKKVNWWGSFHNICYLP